jgi:hypothetical protein
MQKLCPLVGVFPRFTPEATMLADAPHQSAAVWNVSSSSVVLPAFVPAWDSGGYGHLDPALDDRVVAWAARYRVLLGWAASSGDDAQSPAGVCLP